VVALCSGSYDTHELVTSQCLIMKTTISASISVSESFAECSCYCSDMLCSAVLSSAKPRCRTALMQVGRENPCSACQQGTLAAAAGEGPDSSTRSRV
jgi:hypothetical protein